MAEKSDTKSIRVHILGREYGLRVHEEDERHTRRMAAYVNERMERFRDAHPEQAELTTAVITALALAEELHMVREKSETETGVLASEIERLADRLGDSLEDVQIPAESTP
jgi:cell division protein ZapA